MSEAVQAKILVLDPDRDFLEGVVQHKENRDVQVETHHFSLRDRGRLEQIVTDSFADIVVINLDVDDELDFAKLISEIFSVPVALPPMILGTTRRDGVPFKKAAYAAGIDDYLVRPFAVPELWLRLDVMLRIRRLQRRLDFATRKLNVLNMDLERSNKRLEELTVTDELTGLSNMRYMAQALDKHFAILMRHTRPFSIMMIDLDHFKQVNDKNDHLVGSTTLQSVGKTIAAATRASDLKARYGGDEFIVAMPETAELGVRATSERVRAAIAESVHLGSDEKPFRITASIGCASFMPGRHKSYKDLIKEADFAMYLAKHQGRNRVVLFQGFADEIGYDATQSAALTAIEKITEAKE